MLGRYVTLNPENDELYEVEVYSAQRGIIFTTEQACSFTDLLILARLPFLIIMYLGKLWKIDLPHAKSFLS